MARGWESKNVEAQQAEREAAAKAPGRPLTPEEAQAAARRRMLEVSRARAVADRAAARSPAHRAMLDAAIKALDEQIEGVGAGKGGKV
jgi:hypothetical protein